jgi:hypothetical protein
MIIAAVCPKCSEIRAKSKSQVDPKTPLRASDFEALGPQAEPVDGQPSICTVCETGLVFRPYPEGAINGTATYGTVEPPLPDLDPHAIIGRPVTTLFEVRDAEELRDLRPLGRDRILIITTKRIVVLDLAAVADGGL